MLQDAIRLIAAALCCDPRKTTLTVTPAPQLAYVSTLILQLTGYAEVSSKGEVRLTAPVALPPKMTLRFKTLPRDLFFLFAGVAVKLEVVLFADELKDVAPEDLETLEKAFYGSVYAGRAGGRYAVSSAAYGWPFDPEEDFPAALAAGALLGAALTRTETTFIPGKYAETDEVRWALDALKEFGNAPVYNEDGSVTVPTLRGRFDGKAGRRVRHRQPK